MKYCISAGAAAPNLPECDAASGAVRQRMSEVKWLLDAAILRLPTLQGFGYRELVRYIGGECTFLGDRGDIARLRPSRRQMTWFHFDRCIVRF
ncbi:MAG: hypothetical protein ACLUEQ_09040 [Cloacibacillus evryensis]